MPRDKPDTLQLSAAVALELIQLVLERSAGAPGKRQQVRWTRKSMRGRKRKLARAARAARQNKMPVASQCRWPVRALAARVQVRVRVRVRVPRA